MKCESYNSIEMTHMVTSPIHSYHQSVMCVCQSMSTLYCRTCNNQESINHLMQSSYVIYTNQSHENLTKANANQMRQKKNSVRLGRQELC
jgi:hypothetical protein